MATIEPRLIHLLNYSTSPEPTHTDLPPLHELLDLPLPPIDRDGRLEPDATYNGVVPLHVNFDETSPRRYQDETYQDGGYPGVTTLHPLRLRLGQSETIDAYLSSTNVIDDGLDASDDGSKKRHRIPNWKDEFLQLPQPVKKQKPAPPHGPDLPPIINGLHEPPPHAALFPPIASNSFDDSDAGPLRVLQEFTYTVEDKTNQATVSEYDKNANKGRKRAAKPRRKWSEEETNHLLLGVNRHGVGKWTAILEDSDFKFDDRTAGDLKDRFRTCCPAELCGARGEDRAASSVSVPNGRKSTFPENILHDDEGSPPGGMITPPAESDAASKQPKTRAHRKKIADLESLGICAPFKKSHRRERKPFTPEEDAKILEGLEKYGPAWTKIQRDPRFHLSSRQPTDLRDRVRNKYPNVFQNIEKGMYSKDSRGNVIMEPSVKTSISNSLKPSKAAAFEPQINRTSSGEDLPRWPTQFTDSRHSNSSPPSPQLASHLTGGEMDISRLLLDDSQMS